MRGKLYGVVLSAALSLGGAASGAEVTLYNRPACDTPDMLELVTKMWLSDRVEARIFMESEEEPLPGCRLQPTIRSDFSLDRPRSSLSRRGFAVHIVEATYETPDGPTTGYTFLITYRGDTPS